jgi:hypothetical protein
VIRGREEMRIGFACNATQQGDGLKKDYRECGIIMELWWRDALGHET